MEYLADEELDTASLVRTLPDFEVDFSFVYHELHIGLLVATIVMFAVKVRIKTKQSY